MQLETLVLRHQRYLVLLVSTPLPDTTPPSQVTGLGATPTSSSQINLSWTANPAGDGVNHYNVYRGTTLGLLLLLL